MNCNIKTNKEKNYIAITHIIFNDEVGYSQKVNDLINYPNMDNDSCDYKMFYEKEIK